MTIPKKYIVWGVYAAAGLALVWGVLLCLLFGWNLFLTPVFHLPTLGFSEALGIEFLLAPFVAVAIALREVDR